jgi:hypothetical protein
MPSLSLVRLLLHGIGLRGKEADSVEVQPGTKLSTLDEVFDFVDCATDEPVHFNIESKVNPVQKNETRSAAEFVAAMGAIFTARGDEFVNRITHQSFAVGPSSPLKITSDGCSGKQSSSPSQISQLFELPPCAILPPVSSTSFSSYTT